MRRKPSRREQRWRVGHILLVLAVVRSDKRIDEFRIVAPSDCSMRVQDERLMKERSADNAGSINASSQRLRRKRNSDAGVDHMHHFLRGQYVVQFTNRNPQRLSLIHQGSVENRMRAFLKDDPRVLRKVTQ